jgi:glutamine amidotransferase-like uncharacterized protein
MKPIIAIFLHDPECSIDCVEGMHLALSTKYEIKTFGLKEFTKELLENVDVIAFPGGLGEATFFYDHFLGSATELIQEFVENGGKYLGICMGAYWAGSNYFDLLHGVDTVCYVDMHYADVTENDYGTVVDVTWDNNDELMFFWDGCAIVGDLRYCDVIARYSNDAAMAVIQGNVGIIGCHPESQKYWYTDTEVEIKEYWHEEEHWKLLLEFVDRLMAQ